MSEISICVQGYPPVKNEAKSLLAEGHVHAERVTALLAAARDALSTCAWSVDPDTTLGLEVVITSPSLPPSDATNYLGGIGDVLEAKSRRGALTHLGELAAVALYPNDRLLQDVRYSWERGSATRYVVRLWIR